jgi:hypothetical protein
MDRERRQHDDGDLKLDSKMREYVNARKDYNELLRSIYAETDTTKRAALIDKLAKQNEKLVLIAGALRDMWNSLTRSDRTNQSIADLEQDLVKYKQDIQSFQSTSDEQTRLSMVYSDMNAGVVRDRALYFVHILIVLILIIFTFVMFVMRGVSSGVEAVTAPIVGATSSMTAP